MRWRDADCTLEGDSGDRDLAAFAICSRPCVCCLSVVCNARAPYPGGCNFRQIFYGIWHHGHLLTCTENFMEIIQGDRLRQES